MLYNIVKSKGVHSESVSIFKTLDAAKRALSEIARDFHTQITHLEPKTEWERINDAENPDIWRDQVCTNEGTYAVYCLQIEDENDPFYGLF